MKTSFVNGNKKSTPKMSSNQKKMSPTRVTRTIKERQQLLKSYEKLKQDEPLITFRDAASRLGVPKTILYDWVKKGVTPSKPLDQTPVFYALLEQWALANIHRPKKCTIKMLRQEAMRIRDTDALPDIEKTHLKEHTFSHGWGQKQMSDFKGRHNIATPRRQKTNVAKTNKATTNVAKTNKATTNVAKTNKATTNVAKINTLDLNLEFLGTQTDAQGDGKDATVVRRLEDVIKKQSEEMKRLQAQLDDRNQEKDQTIQKLKAEVRTLREQCASNMEALAKKEQELSVLRSVATTNVATTKSNRSRKRRRRQQSQDVSRELSPSERKERRRQMLQALYNWNPMQRVEEVSSNDF